VIFRIRIVRAERAQVKRPVSLREWARVIGLNLLGAGYLTVVQGEWLGGSATIAAACVLILLGFRGRRDERYEDAFPYAFVADLPRRPRATLGRDMRTRNAANFAGAAAAAWLLFEPSLRGALDAAGLAWFMGVWAREMSEPPSRRARTIALGFAIGTAIWLGAVATLLPGARSALALMLVGAVVVGSLVFIGGGLVAALHRTPARLIPAPPKDGPQPTPGP
jgi:hypothetical protein